MRVTRGSSRVAWRIVVVLAHGHRAELVDRELSAVEAIAPLPEERGSRRGAANEERDHGHQRRDEQQRRRGEYQVARALQHARHAAEGRFPHRHERHPAYLAEPGLHEVKGRQVGHEVDRGRRVAQHVEQPADARMARDRHADVDDVDGVPARVLRQVGEAAEQRGPAFARQPLEAAVVEEAGESAMPGLLREPRGEVAADAVCADDDLVAARRCAPHQRAGGPSRRDMSGGERKRRRDEPGEDYRSRKPAGDAEQVPREQHQARDAGPLHDAVTQDTAPVRAAAGAVEPRSRDELESGSVCQGGKCELGPFDAPAVAQYGKQQHERDDRRVEVLLDERDRRGLTGAVSCPAGGARRPCREGDGRAVALCDAGGVKCGHPYPRRASEESIGCTARCARY